MDDQQNCRLRVTGDQLDLAGPPTALRALAALLRHGSATTTEVSVRNGLVVQERGAGPLVVALRAGPTLHLTGGEDNLEIVWSALEGVADAAEAATNRGVERHSHIEHLGPEDVWRSPDTRPLIVTADWPAGADGEPARV